MKIFLHNENEQEERRWIEEERRTYEEKKLCKKTANFVYKDFCKFKFFTTYTF